MTLLAVAIALAGCQGGAQPPTLEVAPRVGALAPDFTVPALEGGEVSLSGYRGRPVLLNFWATWCGPCRAEMPHFQTVYEEAEGKGLALLAINLGEDRARVQSFVRGQKLTFTVGLDLDTAVAGAYRVGPIPTSFFIDREGVIRQIAIGSFPDEGAVRQALESIM